MFDSDEDDTMFDIDEVALAASISASEPKSLAAALHGRNRKEWLNGAVSELKSHVRNKTFSVVDNRSEKTVSSLFVLKLKEDLDKGTVQFKVRFCAKGFSQIPGVHFDETFAPTLNKDCFRILLAYAARKIQHLQLSKGDIETAFLIPVLPDSETIYLRVPKEFTEVARAAGVNFKFGQLLKLHKCIYGLKQASHRWNMDFVNGMKSLGFQQLTKEPCFFIHSTGKSFVVIYVDDILFLGNPADTKYFWKKLGNLFPLKYLGEPRSWLGFQIEKLTNGYKLHMEAYIHKVLKIFNMTKAPTSPTPTASTRLTKAGEPVPSHVPYRQAVGCLLWISQCYRPDIAFAVGQVASYNQDPRVPHWIAVKKIIKYLKGTASFGLRYLYKQDSEMDIVCYSDADWAGSESRKSTGGYLLYFGGCLVA